MMSGVKLLVISHDLTGGGFRRVHTSGSLQASDYSDRAVEV